MEIILKESRFIAKLSSVDDNLKNMIDEILKCT